MLAPDKSEKNRSGHDYLSQTHTHPRKIIQMIHDLNPTHYTKNNLMYHVTCVSSEHDQLHSSMTEVYLDWKKNMISVLIFN